MELNVIIKFVNFKNGDEYIQIIKQTSMYW